MLFNYFTETNSQKILIFLAKNTGVSYYEKEIAEHLNLNPSSIHVVLRAMEKEKFILKQNKGKMNFYTLNDNFYQVKEIKTLAILIYIEPLINSLIPITNKISLFGSCASGAYTVESDIDLFIETRKEKEVYNIISNFVEKTGEEKKIQAIVKTSEELLSQKNKILLKEIEKGKILYEREIREPLF